MGAGTIGNVSEDLGPVLELNPVDAVGKRLQHDPLHEWGTSRHERRLYQTQHYYSSDGPRPFEPGWAVRISGPASVMATVCSK